MALSNGRHLAFPFRIGGDGRSVAPADDDAHVRDELLQLLLTSPAERLFLPDFGGGVRKLVFEPASEALRGVVKARITNGLTRWLGHRLTVELIEVVWDDAAATLEVTLKYRPAGSPDSRVIKFQRSSR
ncbi:GPW/gp25 family protein [Metapseudomonas resinovorans]|uniref:GPW/gp25 family protein n=1 Tax=Metapseudomonas resinovorans TaxID=53412 RepID=UPI00042889CA|nr:GPW/gp25 family protein [Pseudomonas resinovorans]MDE3737759.1 GPW/gp25 family protein [Pseudomonas resinovorans]